MSEMIPEEMLDMVLIEDVVIDYLVDLGHDVRTYRPLGDNNKSFVVLEFGPTVRQKSAMEGKKTKVSVTCYNSEETSALRKAKILNILLQNQMENFVKKDKGLIKSEYTDFFVAPQYEGEYGYGFELELLHFYN